jgi:hypothetical protein
MTQKKAQEANQEKGEEEAILEKTAWYHTSREMEREQPK